MSITDVMSQLTAMQQLATQLAAPPAPVAGATANSFASVLDAASGATTAPPGAASGSAAPATSGTPASAGSLSEATLLSTILEQSQAQSLLGSLGSSDSSGSLGGLDSLASLLPSLSAAATASSPAPAAAPSSTTTGVAGAAAGADGAATVAPITATTPNTSGERVLTAAQSQLGVAEQPPGSNDGAQIATYRAAVAGSQPGEPWCADFASWAAAQAGEPLGPNGQGFSSVAGLTGWAAASGRLLPASATPTPGDLILFGDRHIGVVESVNPDGSLTTVEGNYANAVSQVHRSPSEATGYVQM